MSTLRPAILAIGLLLALAPARLAAQKPLESLWYTVDSEESIQGFIRNADMVSIVAPQSYRMDEHGTLWGDVDPRLVKVAREKGVKIVPLIVNPGFDQPMFHALLNNPVARAKAVANIQALCRDRDYDGIQFDFENIHINDRDAFTAFYRETAKALHDVGCTISVAAVPRDSDYPGENAYHKWMFEYWRGAYDYKALADAGDFISIMTYDQHTRRTPPGPVAGLAWMERVVKFLLDQGVPASKISLGIPAYSVYWYPTYDERNGGRQWGSGVSYASAIGLLEAAGVTPVMDDRNKTFFGIWENNGVHEYVYLENAETFRHKLDLARKYDLRGFSVWRLGQEDPAVWDLLRGQRIAGR